MKAQDFVNLVNNVLKEIENKPKRYHFVCNGGSSAGPMVDFFKDVEECKCGNTGDGTSDYGGWINAPMCRNGCDRMLKGTFEISDVEWRENYCYKNFADTLLSRLNNPHHKGE